MRKSRAHFICSPLRKENTCVAVVALGAAGIEYFCDFCWRSDVEGTVGCCFTLADSQFLWPGFVMHRSMWSHSAGLT